MSDYDPSDEDELGPEDLEYFKKRLQEERDKVLARLARHRQEATNENTAAPDEMDQARSLADQAYLLRLAHKEQNLLKQIDKAIAKFESGEYGFCEGTGDPIGRQRLELRPWTRFSVAYKEEVEARKRSHRRS
jgi:DnaK suppressor protein